MLPGRTSRLTATIAWPSVDGVDDVPPPLPSVSLRVLVAADDPLARRMLASLLPPAVTAVPVGAQGDLRLAARESQADVVLWDLGADPTRAGDRLVDAEPLEVPVIMLLPDATWCRAALAAGARGVLPREVDAPALGATVDAVLRGLVVIEPGLCAQMVARMGDAPAGVASPPRVSEGTDEPLTAREREVLQLLAEGLANKHIAQRLGISDHTVKFHVNAVMAKLGVQSRTEAVVRALRQGLVML